VPLDDVKVYVWGVKGQLELLGPFFFWDCKLILICNTHCDAIYWTPAQLHKNLHLFSREM
jgi:hypothetical protein